MVHTHTGARTHRMLSIKLSLHDFAQLTPVLLSLAFPTDHFYIRKYNLCLKFIILQLRSHLNFQIDRKLCMCIQLRTSTHTHNKLLKYFT